MATHHGHQSGEIPHPGKTVGVDDHTVATDRLSGSISQTGKTVVVGVSPTTVGDEVPGGQVDQTGKTKTELAMAAIEANSDKTHKEIAAIAGVSTTTIGTAWALLVKQGKIQRLRRSLEESISRRGRRDFPL